MISIADILLQKIHTPHVNFMLTVLLKAIADGNCTSQVLVNHQVIHQTHVLTLCHIVEIQLKLKHVKLLVICHHARLIQIVIG